MKKRFFIIMFGYVAVSSFITLDGTQKLNNTYSDQPDVSNPGPDTANFPTSPFTLPKGRAYVENFPLAIDLQGNKTPQVYNWPFLIRFGIIDDAELRIGSQGITHISATDEQLATNGFSPIILGTKVHAWGTKDLLWIPSCGIEAYLITTIASKNLKIGTQCVFNLLFNHNFPGDFSFEWNVGFISRPYCVGKTKRDVCGAISWSLHKELVSWFAIFFQGYYITPKQPLYPTQLVLGIGLQSTITKRLCIYGNYNWSFFENTNPDLINVGFTIAF